MKLIADEMCHSPALNIWISPWVCTDTPPPSALKIEHIQKGKCDILITRKLMVLLNQCERDDN